MGFQSAAITTGTSAREVAHEREDGELAKHIHRLFSAKRQVYGSPRIHAELVAGRPSSRPVGTVRRKGALRAPNLLNRQFSAQQPNAKWGSSTTDVWTAEGWLYLAVILDLFWRLVVGWAMGATNDEQGVSLALEMALVRRSPPRELLLHSDQGSTSTSTGYQARVAALGIVVSMSRCGDCYENAAMESFAEHPQRGMRGSAAVPNPARGPTSHL